MAFSMTWSQPGPPLQKNRLPPAFRHERRKVTRDEKTNDDFFPEHLPIHDERAGHPLPLANRPRRGPVSVYMRVRIIMPAAMVTTAAFVLPGFDFAARLFFEVKRKNETRQQP